MLSAIRPAIVSTLFFTLLLGLAYPLAVTEAARALTPFQANGSLIRDKSGQVVGSALIAQAFAKPEYLHPRPSAAGKGYDATSSGGSNLGPLNPDLIKRVKTDADALRKEDGATVIPADAVTTSGSGLDPEVSPANARMQVARIALARGIDAAQVQAVIDQNTTGPTWGFLGQPHVNVLKVNLALDARYPVGHVRAR
jgi:potassium-transporting ATPase KdpC subunit